MPALFTADNSSYSDLDVGPADISGGQQWLASTRQISHTMSQETSISRNGNGFTSFTLSLQACHRWANDSLHALFVWTVAKVGGSLVVMVLISETNFSVSHPSKLIDSSL